METTKKIINTRRDKILAEIQTNSKVFVNSLSEKFEVSPITIRRDLRILEEEGMIDRFYGGARVKTVFNNTKHRDYDAICKMGEVASRYVEDNDTLFLNGSKIGLKMIEYIKNKNVTIITNNAEAASLKGNENVKIILTGGEVNPIKKSLTGKFTVHNIKSIAVNKCFLGCSGITKNGFSSIIEKEAEINRLMIKSCIGKIFILADSKKIGRECEFSISKVSSTHTLITNKGSSHDLIEIKKQGVRVITIN